MRNIRDHNAINIGLNFAVISAVITTLGLMVGLNATTNSLLIVMGGILTIAIADSMSDALGIHVSQESIKKN
jgi:vacuolar iron transporter family protein